MTKALFEKSFINYNTDEGNARGYCFCPGSSLIYVTATVFICQAWANYLKLSLCLLMTRKLCQLQ